MKVIMEVRELPIGAVVTKITGEKRYTIKDKISVYGDSALQKELRSIDGTRFLIPVDGDLTINVVSAYTEMLWNVTDEELYNFMYERTQCDHK